MKILFALSGWLLWNWQQFKLNQVSGVTSISTHGAFDSEYKIIQAIVAKMSTRKNW